MLRASSTAVTGERIDAVDAVGGASGEVPHGPALVAFVDAVVGGDAVAARTALCAEAGPAAVVDAAAVIANFEMMTRVADGTGAHQLPGRLATLQDERDRLGLDHYPSAR